MHAGYQLTRFPAPDAFPDQDAGNRQILLIPPYLSHKPDTSSWLWSALHLPNTCILPPIRNPPTLFQLSCKNKEKLERPCRMPGDDSVDSEARIRVDVLRGRQPWSIVSHSLLSASCPALTATMGMRENMIGFGSRVVAVYHLHSFVEG